MDIRTAAILAGSGALALGILGASFWTYGAYQYRQGKADCEEAVRVAGLEVFKSEAERIIGVADRFDGIAEKLANVQPQVIKEFHNVTTVKPLPADCVFDADRMRAGNAAISAANAARVNKR